MHLRVQKPSNEGLNKGPRGVPILSEEGPRKRSIGVQTAVPSREYVGPRARASQAPEFFKRGWMHRPRTVSTLCVALALIFVFSLVMAKQKSTQTMRLTAGAVASLLIFLVFGTLQLPDGLLVRPSPIFWRFVKSCSVVYLLGLVFLLFQDLRDVRAGLHWMDPLSGIPMEERNYAEECNSWSAMTDKLDVFVLAHFLGWTVKAMVIRDSRLLWILSLLFEWMEISFRHVLPNFWECWWDHLLLDVFGCNLLGIYLGLALCRRFQVLQYRWHEQYAVSLRALGDTATRSLSFGYGSSTKPANFAYAAAADAAARPALAAAAASSPSACVSPREAPNCTLDGRKDEGGLKHELPQQQGEELRQKQQKHQKQQQKPGEKASFSFKAALRQFLPYELTAYHWPSMLQSARSFTGIVFFCVVVTLLDLNVFFLKAELYLHSSHPIIIARLTLFSLAAAAGTREFYAYLTDSQSPRMGVQCWLDLAMVAVEALLAFKYYSVEGALQPHPPCPTWIMACWVVLGVLLSLTVTYLAVYPHVSEATRSDAVRSFTVTPQQDLPRNKRD